MPDNVDVSPSAEYRVATDERTINSVLVQIQRTAEIGASAIASGHVSISTTAAIVAARETRRRVVIKNPDSTNTLYVGPLGVSTANGIALLPGESISVNTSAAVHGVASSGTISAQYIEEYDS